MGLPVKRRRALLTSTRSRNSRPDSSRRHGYATTFCDLQGHKVFDVVLGRSEAALESYLERLPGKEPRSRGQLLPRAVLDAGDSGECCGGNPAGRLATNEDIVDTIVFLCSDAAPYIHGHTIEVNGGLLAP